MPKMTVKAQSILGGISPSQYFASEGQYLGAVGIDPDIPLSSSDIRTSGIINPTVYEKFSGTNVNSQVIAIINNPKDTNTYVVLSNGRLVRYSSALTSASETLIGTVTGSVAKGAWYYNNFIYIATGTDLSRYGPLDGTPALTNTVWTGATLGSLTALTNTTYPTVRGLQIPNHWGCIHGDGSSYFLDFINGQGLVHRVNTRKVTSEGDTNGGTVPSAYNVLDLPFGFYPTSISSYSTDIAILTIQTTDNSINQGKAALFLWDPTNTDTFYRGPVYLPDPLATAMLYVNGQLLIWTGNGQGGMRISQYVGGDVVSDIGYLEEGAPPFAGGVDVLGGRIIWGGFTTYPATSASVFALGSKNFRLPKGIHNIVKSTSSGTTQMVTALKYVQQANNANPRPLVAWTDDAGQGMDKLSTTATYSSTWRSELFQIGRTFKITKIRIPLGATVAAGMSIAPTVFIDDGSSSTALSAINNTNYSGKRFIEYKHPELKNLGGVNNFYIDLVFGSTIALPVLLPIEFEIEVYEDE